MSQPAVEREAVRAWAAEPSIRPRTGSRELVEVDIIPPVLELQIDEKRLMIVEGRSNSELIPLQ
jgi:hypothetical protein